MCSPRQAVPEDAPRSEALHQLMTLAKLRLEDAVRWQLLDSSQAYSAALEAYQV